MLLNDFFTPEGKEIIKKQYFLYNLGFIKKGYILYKVTNDEHMEMFGVIFSECFKEGGLVFLRGDLGAGKTTLVRGIMRGLGYLGVVSSPTYALIESYKVGSIEIHHMDLYRLTCSEELDFIGARDFFGDKSLCLIEWPERGLGFLPVSDLTIEITPEHVGRTLKVFSQSSRGDYMYNALIKKIDR